MAQATPFPKKHILILGGSYGGVATAHYVSKHIIPALPNPSSYQVILVSASTQAMCRPACPRALISDDMFPQDKLFVSITQQLKQYGSEMCRFVHGTATMVNHEKRSVSVKLSTGEEEEFGFHTLVIATGASTPSPLLGLNTDSTALREAWATFRKALPTAKSIVIAGGGPAGVEVAGELGEYLNGCAGWFESKLNSPKVDIMLITSGKEILPHLRPTIAQTAEGYLAKVGVTIIKNARVERLEPENTGLAIASLVTKATLSLSNGTTLSADLYIPATGAKPNTSFIPPSLLELDGRIKTNKQTLRVDAASHPRIYAIGDASSYARPAIHNIIAAIPILGANIKRDLLLDAGKPESEVGPESIFEEDLRETQLVPIGKSKGVGSAMGWRIPSWIVWMIKGRDYWLWTTAKLWSGRQ
ncbi:FAD/NAD(P)-binding domain-containing protein [Cucurbitaria berberidis CBS 394.84]|uniref:FAD/NAD(P)-binding domain-containing protein n=1 Tax=Cucurbitaria berberidis CBS 394.84 TaxID=1168544 RepID=A0A9P4G9U4_9PLEO|nr:FAD/NAD(P)-binding domain-containing protein [Cucurbitaria berberidis CBS 394.84]KAF1841527.1 FAD/NAD(P)-binding domain-containing protein [Cucurbitaria berberidis CBS 394.84]